MRVSCTWCGTEHNRKPSDVREVNFCSRECYWQYKRRNQVVVACEGCGKEVRKPPSHARRCARHFCSHKCKNRVLNPEKNKNLMTPEVRAKLRRAHLGKGEGKSYPKFYGRHLHRVVAERKLGRPLRPGEVVHHIDGDIHNNDPDNLVVFSSQSLHAAFHRIVGDFVPGGDAR